MTIIKAYAVHEADGQLEPFEYDPGALDAKDLEIVVEYCGVCHSDLSLLKNEWGLSAFFHCCTVYPCTVYPCTVYPCTVYPQHTYLAPLPSWEGCP